MINTLKIKMKMLTFWNLQLLIVCFLTVPSHVLSLSVTVPTTQSAFVNDAVEFNCAILGNKGFNQFVWMFRFPDETTSHYIPAEQTTSVQLYNREAGEHGMYNIEYSTENIEGDTLYKLLLRIEGVLPADEAKFACGYRIPTQPTPSVLGNWVDLTILVPPEETLPRCDFELSRDSTVMVTLTCTMAGGIPPPDLTWYKGNSMIGQSSVESNVIQYEIQPSDNGVEFICTADGPSLVVRGSCSVMPFRVDPSVSISTVTSMPMAEGTDLIVNLRCSWHTEDI